MRAVRRRAGVILAAVLAVTAGGLCWSRMSAQAAQRPGSSREAGDTPASPAEQAGQRVREGSVLDAQGSFKINGDRGIFQTVDGTGRYTVLENLNLERIAAAISESPDQLVWTVNGTVTEYRGTNYLLVQRAMIKPKSKPGAKLGPAERKPASAQSLPSQSPPATGKPE